MKKSIGEIAITGGSGYIGGSLARRLMQLKEKVKIVDVKEPGFKIDNVVIADVTDPQEIQDSLYFAKTVYHMAAVVSKLRGREDRARCIEINVAGTLNVLEACRKLDVDRLIHVSTSEVLGDPIYLPTDEDHPRNPRTTYGMTKCCAEDLCKEYARTYGLNVVIPRLYMIYGPDDFRELAYHSAIAKFVALALRGKQPTAYIGCYRSWIHIEDCIDALMLFREKGRAGQVYDITAPPDQCLSMYELARQIISQCKRSYVNMYVQPKLEKAPVSDTRIKMSSGAKAYKELEWKPKKTLKTELHSLIDGWKKQLGM